MESLCCCSILEKKLGLKTVKELGEGGQGLVLLCEEPGTGLRFACKVIPSHRMRMRNNTSTSAGKKRKLTAPEIKQQVKKKRLGHEETRQNADLRREADILFHLRGIHGILPLVATLEGEDGCIHVLTPFCNAGDLLHTFHPLSDRESAHIITSLARALSACHARGIVHRDIKPGNVLRRRLPGSDREEILLADFGLATCISPGQTLHDIVGTSPFRAPEVIRGCYDHRADIWSLGVLLYMLLTFTMPFIHHLDDDASEATIHEAILYTELSLNNSQLGLSPSAQHLLRGMLCKDPQQRLTLHQVLHHPWTLLHTHESLPELPPGFESAQPRSNTTPTCTTPSIACPAIINIPSSTSVPCPTITIPSSTSLACPAQPRPNTMKTTPSIACPSIININASSSTSTSEEDESPIRFTRVVQPGQKGDCYRQHWRAIPLAPAYRAPWLC